jgi:hypothetical protein
MLHMHLSCFRPSFYALFLPLCTQVANAPLRFGLRTASASKPLAPSAPKGSEQSAAPVLRKKAGLKNIERRRQQKLEAAKARLGAAEEALKTMEVAAVGEVVEAPAGVELKEQGQERLGMCRGCGSWFQTRNALAAGYLPPTSVPRLLRLYAQGEQEDARAQRERPKLKRPIAQDGIDEDRKGLLFFERGPNGPSKVERENLYIQAHDGKLRRREFLNDGEAGFGMVPDSLIMEEDDLKLLEEQEKEERTPVRCQRCHRLTHHSGKM